MLPNRALRAPPLPLELPSRLRPVLSGVIYLLNTRWARRSPIQSPMASVPLVALVALPFAAVWAYVHDPNPVTASVSVSIFVISIFLMFLASTLYHSMNPASKHKAVFHILDHIFIYVAIAAVTPRSPYRSSAAAGDIHHPSCSGRWCCRHLLQVAVAQLDPGHQPDDLPGDGMDDRLLHAAFRASRLECRCSC